MALDTPLWDPAIAAAAGAGFAGVLGAIVVAITFQIVLGRSTAGPATGPNQLQSSVVAPFATLLLLVAAYLYVVLSGTVTKIGAVASACSANPPNIDVCQPGLSFIWSAAAMFAISGSYLGLGAVALTFTLVAVVNEHPKGSEKSVRDAMLLFYVAGSSIAVLALIWGYRDATWVFQLRRMHVIDYLTAEGGAYWLLGGLIVGYSAAIGHAAAAIGHVATSATGYSTIARYTIISTTSGFVLLPVLWFLVVQGTAPGEHPIGVAILSQVMLAWTATVVTFLTIWLPQMTASRNWSARRVRAILGI
jgi:hypothetical protein